MMAGNGAAYMVIRNTGGADDALIGAASDVADMVELHETTMEGSMAGMHPVEAIPVPAGGSVSLEPGGYHVMLIGLKEELQVGQTITLTLTFEKAGQITVQAEVREE
jgi:copper(I)-binding protein